MGASDDPLAVVDPKLRIRGLKGVRIADASVFPKMVTAKCVFFSCLFNIFTDVFV
jgi:choline dehydrogenase-like flavoprotein